MKPKSLVVGALFLSAAVGTAVGASIHNSALSLVGGLTSVVGAAFVLSQLAALVGKH